MEGAEVVFLSWVAVEEAEVAIEVEVDHQMAIKIAVVDQLIRLRTSKVEFNHLNLYNRLFKRTKI